MRTTACLLMLVAGCAGVVDPDAGRIIGGTGFSDDTGISPAPETPVRNSFDGYWFLSYTVEPRQAFFGTGSVLVEVSGGGATCVREGAKESCPIDWGNPLRARPITIDNGLVRIEFMMGFPACNYDNLSGFQDESLIEVVIVGSEIAGTGGLVFDAALSQRYIFSEEIVLSEGTLEHFPDVRTNSCGFDSFE